MNSKRQTDFIFESENDKKVTLKDLCPQDKAKIGKLIKKLAEEKQEKENLLQIIDQTKQAYEQRLSKKPQPLEISNISKSITEKETQLKQDIQQLDGEILDLLGKEKQQYSAFQSGQKQSSRTISPPNHQSPTFKGLKNDSQVKQKQYEIFKQQLSLEPSPSFFLSQINTCRDPNLSVGVQQSAVQPSSNTPVRYDESSIHPEDPSPPEKKVSIHSKSQSKSKSKSKSKKKQLLMNKVAEFERIIQRMNFSKTESEVSQDSMNNQTVQEVFKKLLYLEDELHRFQSNQFQEHSKDQSIPSQRKIQQNLQEQFHLTSQQQQYQTQSQQLYPSQQQSQQQQYQQQQQNEEDILIELLNSSSNYMSKPQQPQPEDKSQSMNTSLYGTSFLSLVDNIDFNTPSSLGSTPAQLHVDQYQQSVLNKYNTLVKELKQEILFR